MQNRISKLLLIPCIVLATIAMGSLALSFSISSKVEWLNNFLLNFGTEMIGILLTIVLIDRAIRAYEEGERRKYQALALLQLRAPLLNQVRMFANILRVTAHPPRPKTYKTVSDMFDNDFYKQIEWLDFSKNSPLLGQLWFDYLSNQCSRFKDSLGVLLEKYAVYLDVEIIDLIEQLINSNFIAYVLAVPGIHKINQLPNVTQPADYFGDRDYYGGSRRIIREYTLLFSELVENYNHHVSEDKRILVEEYLWRENMKPYYGSGRVAQPSKITVK